MKMFHLITSAIYRSVKRKNAQRLMKMSLFVVCLITSAQSFSHYTLATFKPSSASQIIETQNCPIQFYQVNLPQNGKLCQVFAAELPASMVFFVPQTPNEVLKYYRSFENTWADTKQVKQRYVLVSVDSKSRLIISADGAGTQVDVLILEG